MEDRLNVSIVSKTRGRRKRKRKNKQDEEEEEQGRRLGTGRINEEEQEH